MSKHFTVGVVVGGVASLTPFLLPAMIVIGIWTLYLRGVSDGGDTATDGFLWVSAWTAILSAAMTGVVFLVAGLWMAPKATITTVGTIVLLASVKRRLRFKRLQKDQ